MIRPTLSDFQSIIPLEKFYKIAEETKFPIEKVCDFYHHQQDVQNRKVLYAFQSDKYEEDNIKYKEDEFYLKFLKFGGADDKTQRYNYHIEQLFNALVLKGWHTPQQGLETLANGKSFEYVPKEIICELDRFIFRIYEEAGISYKDSLLDYIRERLANPSATYEDGKKFYEFSEEELGLCPSYSYDLNNPLFFPSIKQQTVVVSKEDADLWASRTDKHKQTTDKVLKVGEKIFSIHSEVLVKSCEYFRLLLQGGFNESKGKEIPITLQIEPNSFEKILKFIYTKAIDFKDESFKDLYEITRCAQEIELKSLEKECVMEYRRRLELKNFKEILRAAHNLQNEGLKQQCQLFLKMHLKWIEENITAHEMSVEELQATYADARFLKNTPFMDACIKAIEIGKKIEPLLTVTKKEAL